MNVLSKLLTLVLLAAAGAADLASDVTAWWSRPRPRVLHCPWCLTLHVDRGEWATRPHRTHLCERCGTTWRPENVPTVGVAPASSCRDEEAE